MGKLTKIIFSSVFLAAFILTTVGFSLPSWVETSDYRVGLFEVCANFLNEWECENFKSELWGKH